MWDFNTGVTPPEMIKKRPAARPYGMTDKAVEHRTNMSERLAVKYIWRPGTGWCHPRLDETGGPQCPNNIAPATRVPRVAPGAWISNAARRGTRR